jgi:hypothetical protein
MKNCKPVYSLFVLSILALFLAGCGGSTGPEIKLPPEPQAASQADLESLFSQISVQLQSAKPGSDNASQLAGQLKTVGSELAQRAAAVVRTRLSEAGRIEGRVPLGAIERELGSLDEIERYDADVHQEISRDLTRELESTKAAIDSRERELIALSEDRVLARLQLLSMLSALSGTGSQDQARYAQERDGILREVSKEAEEAIRNEDYEKAQDLLNIVQEVNPEDEQARLRKCEVDGKVA